MGKNLKILLSAYSCEPDKGSEPEVGWQWAKNLAPLHQVTVVTRSNNAQSISRALSSLPEPHPRFEYYDLPWIFVWCKKIGMPVAIYYFIWQMGLRWHFRGRLSQFDIIHHLTFNSFRQPGFWWLCKVPVVLGPLGGGQICPWRFFPLMRGRKIAEFIRSCSVIASPLLPQVWASFLAASKILVANSDTEKRIPGLFRHKVVRLLETGVSEGLIRPQGNDQPQTAEIRLLWLSWLLPIKAPELAVRAFARAHKLNTSLRLTMAGDGPLRGSLQALAEQLGVAGQIEWKGRVPRTAVSAMLAQHHIFLFTSLRDTSGNVLLEAMAAGLPTITLRHQGAAEIATDETSIRICPEKISQTIGDITEAILKLASSAQLRTEKGRAGGRRISQVFAWERKADQMSAVYESISKPG